MIYSLEEYGFAADSTLDFFHPKAAEEIRPHDRVLVKGGRLYQVAYVNEYPLSNAIQITCYGSYHISSHKGEKWLVDDWSNFVMEVAE